MGLCKDCKELCPGIDGKRAALVVMCEMRLRELLRERAVPSLKCLREMRLGEVLRAAQRCSGARREYVESSTALQRRS